MTFDDWVRIAPLLSAIAIATSATVALGVFIYTRRINRRRATLDMIMRTFLDEVGRQRYDDFKAVIRRDEDPNDPFDLTSLVEWTPENAKEWSVVKNQLNDYELVSLGISRGLFGERFYKLWFHRQFTKDYEQVEKLILALQKKRPTHFTEYSKLYRRWMKKKHPDAEHTRLKMAWWGLTGQYDKVDQARIQMKLYQQAGEATPASANHRPNSV